jgi:hypothetical protein
MEGEFLSFQSARQQDAQLLRKVILHGGDQLHLLSNAFGEDVVELVSAGPR